MKQISKVTGRDKPPFVNGWYQDIHKKGIRNHIINDKNIQPVYSIGIRGWQMYNADNVIGNRETTGRIELPNYETFSTLGEIENYKFWGILDADAPRQKKKKKNTDEKKKK